MSNSTEQSVEQSVDVAINIPEQQFNDASYFQYQQGLFYELMAECLIKWINQINVKPKSEQEDAGITTTPVRSFIDSWTYALYTRGIKRRVINYGADLLDFSGYQSVDELPNADQLRANGVIGVSAEADAAYLDAAKAGNAFQHVFYGRTSSALLQFYYDKQAPGFNKSDPLTMFCRHVVFDINTMSIVSVGLPGAINYDTFMTSIGSDGVSIEEFLEGTMVVYNQRLALYGQQSVSASQDESNDQTIKNIEQKQPKNDWSLSTRRKLGTSFFNNPGKSFDQMFRENNESAGTKFGDIDYLADKVLVFNVEHIENRVVNPAITNRNTLVAVYQLASDINLIQQSVGNVLNAVYNTGSMVAKTGTEFTDEQMTIRYAIMTHATTCSVKQIQVADVANELAKQGIYGIRTPNKLFVYHGTEPMSVISSMISNMDKFMPGVVLKTTGETRRTKVRNPVHYELLHIKGSGSITISDRNKHNLFKVYWNLRQRGVDAIQQFLDVFDNKSATYKNIFMWYDILISGMNHQLFLEYHNVFVRKTMQAQAISYAFKPLCGELHKIYKSERKPITRDTVIQFINGLDHNQVYWRLFGIDA